MPAPSSVPLQSMTISPNGLLGSARFSLRWFTSQNLIYLVMATLVLSLATRADDAQPAVTNTNIKPTGEANTPDDIQTAFFEKQIRPVLVAHCYQCHSANGEKIQGGLSLDTREGIRKGGDSGPAVVPHKVDESLLIAAIRYDGFEMPPKQRLPQQVVDNFVKWIEMGAPDPREGAAPTRETRVIDIAAAREHWAFQPLRRHPIPDATPDTWSLDPIDRFLEAKRQSAGIVPMPDADRHALLRRLTFDITGLPPTTDEINAFIADTSPTALETVVDRLLASPQFGEHWGRHWLDLARYADSNGGDINLTHKEAWRYRDYVVSAFNQDKPFHQFVREQIAGDLLPARSDAQRAEQVIATGYLVIGPKMLSERDKEKLHMDVVDEQLDTIGKTFLGMTIGCARCHDHKFDPIPTADYYAMGGILRSTTTVFGIRMGNVNVSGWNEVPLPLTEAHAEALREHAEAVKRLEQQLRDAKSQLDKLTKLDSPSDSSTGNSPQEYLGIVVDDTAATKVGYWKSSKLSPSYVGAGYIHDDRQDKGMKSVTYVPEILVAGEYEVRVSYTANTGRDAKVPVTVNHANGSTELFVNQEQKPSLEGLFHPLGRFTFQAGKTGSVVISTTNTTGHVIADAVQFVPVDALKESPKLVWKKASPPTASPDPNTKPQSTPSIETPELTPEQLAEIEARKQRQQQQAQLTSTVKEFEAELKKLKGQAPPPAPMAMAASDREQPEDCAICIRGEPHNRGSKAPRGFLQVVDVSEPVEISTGESGRRELADWLVSPQNPLTPRVTVNRVWQHLMGAGLVRTVDNFGELGDRPTHPELLDFLALNFIESNWSTKQLIRQIVLSRTYRLGSQYSEGTFQADPENRLLWRHERRPITAESIRDAILLASDSLDQTAGGSSVTHLGESAVGNNPGEAKDNQGPVPSARRSLYLPIIRNDLPDELTLFNFADPDVCTGERSRTTVPSQALWMFNSPFVRQHSAKIAESLLAEEHSSEEARIATLYLKLLGRPPREDEVSRAKGYLTQAPLDNSSVSPETEAKNRWSSLAHALIATAEFRLLD
ncbi:MAG: DUF1553 domain-containing protein [Planctomycetaceae bacterium]